MDIIARFPVVRPEVAVSARSAEATGPGPAASPSRSRAADPATSRPTPFPGASLVVLAVVAAVAWSLAAWNDTARLGRQRRPDRIALQPPTATQPATP